MTANQIRALLTSGWDDGLVWNMFQALMDVLDVLDDIPLPAAHYEDQALVLERELLRAISVALTQGGAP